MGSKCTILAFSTKRLCSICEPRQAPDTTAPIPTAPLKSTAYVNPNAQSKKHSLAAIALHKGSAVVAGRDGGGFEERDSHYRHPVPKQKVEYGC